MASYDLLVVGGGINGCGIARDAAGRGLRVLLVERGDLAGATSSASTKLVHGGLRYLEHYAFRLVRDALVEREVLLRAAPHLIRPVRFVLPHHPGLRPYAVLRLGLWVYDHLGGRRLLPGTRALDFGRDPAGGVLRAEFKRGFEYSDCWVDDARLVVANARDAADRGAAVRVRSEVVTAHRRGVRWEARLVDRRSGRSEVVEAGALVNATGPWVARFARDVLGQVAPPKVRLVRGSHLVLPRLFDDDRAYVFQEADGRIVFAIPYEDDFTLVGTTDRDQTGDPGEARIAADEVEYLCAAASRYLRTAVRPEAAVHAFAGVRPLSDAGASSAARASRDYTLSLDAPTGNAPLLTVVGGKITTYRRLAEAVLARLGPHLPPAGGPWTATAPLPGGDFPATGFAALLAQLAERFPFLDAGQVRRLGRAYGTLAADVLGHARHPSQLGQDFGAGLSEAEVRWLMHREWATAAEDVVWRRSKLGLRLTADQVAALDAFIANPSAALPARAVA